MSTIISALLNLCYGSVHKVVYRKDAQAYYVVQQWIGTGWSRDIDGPYPDVTTAIIAAQNYWRD